jgi:hypothetical protein
LVLKDLSLGTKISNEQAGEIPASSSAAAKQQQKEPSTPV